MANRDLTQSEKDSLESLIDSSNMQSVLMALSEICGGKSQHIAENWQDNATAKAWASAEGVLGVAAVNRYVTAISL